MSDDNKWHDVSCSSGKYHFICQYEDCDEENTTWFEGKSYNVYESRVNFKDAEKICEESRGQLLTLDNEGISDFISAVLRSKAKPKLNAYIAYFFKHDNFWGAFLQYFAVHGFLIIIIGLCMDGGESLTSKFLRTKAMQFLGRISLSLYLLHIPIMGYWSLMINGPQTHYKTYEEIQR